ncbi:MAG: (d)CMP kinase [Lactobacillus sp.]|jgi:cytidylate kinase|uniref:Cytidylate kinase n=2 Tax=Lactobacillus porci TaxID=2012477 RepID=A0A6A8MEX7_9LACO|nr:(d)CMP kinase [Lactobacillus porci]MDD6416818.1 (d)CMP kinase [Lactobacillus porci]MST87354.1 (d)CMP kinase [Lactobacillus porci]
MQVAIDGPASAGKSTVAKIVANKLSFVYIDTGAMYRACTLIARDHDLEYGNEKGILAAIDEDGIKLEPGEKGQKVIVAGKDVSLEIRTPEITAHVSEVSALPGVRAKMVDLQRQLAGSTNVIMDGRDIGTTVLPKADVKIFLVASARSRAERRMLDWQEKGIEAKQSLEEIEADISKRDYLDSHREISPLKKADDAIEIDSTHMTIDQVVDAILTEIKKKQK